MRPATSSPRWFEPAKRAPLDPAPKRSATGPRSQRVPSRERVGNDECYQPCVRAAGGNRPALPDLKLRPRPNGRILTLPPGTPVSDPASLKNHLKTRRIGNRRSTSAAGSGAVSGMRPVPR